MARFYGTIKGSRGKVSRLGTPNSGLETVAAGWQGSVRVYLFDKNGIDWCNVCLIPWEGKGTTRVLYDGPVSGACLKNFIHEPTAGVDL